MSVLYPRSIAWQRELGNATSPDAFFSTTTLSRIHKVKEALAAAGYEVQEHAVDLVYLDKFIPIYEQLIGSKENGHVFDVRAAIEGWVAKGIGYRAISLWQGDQLVGGLIYVIYDTSVSCAYRVFPHDLAIKLPVNLSMAIEYTFFGTALRLGKQRIYHGKDRNPYGQNANIGLAQYKARLGCVPFVSRAEDNVAIPVPLDCGTVDTLFYLQPIKGRKITQAIFVSDVHPDELREKFSVLFAEDAAVKIQIVRHDELAAFVSSAA